MRASRLGCHQLEVGQYWIRQRGFRGTKEVELGTDHVARLPWLTALDGTVSVLQLTGALVDRDGKAVRIGAEGLMVHRTPMKVSALGAQALITGEDMRELRTARRRDLVGDPLVWHVAVSSLVEHLTGRPVGSTATTLPFWNIPSAPTVGPTGSWAILGAPLR